MLCCTDPSFVFTIPMSKGRERVSILHVDSFKYTKNNESEQHRFSLHLNFQISTSKDIIGVIEWNK